MLIEGQHTLNYGQRDFSSSTREILEKTFADIQMTKPKEVWIVIVWDASTMCKQYSFPKVVLRIGFRRIYMSRYKCSANHFALWLPRPWWQQKLFGVLQLLCQLRMSLGLCPTTVLKWDKTTYRKPHTPPFIRSEPVCCPANALTYCWQCNCSVGVPAVYSGKLQRAIFLMCAEKCWGVEYCPFILFSFSQPPKESAPSAQQLSWNYQVKDLPK